MSESVVENVDNRIPVNIITGFLGSGKTTLLNKWVNSPLFKDTLVLINEFGNVGLDHELVQAVDDTVVLLGSGCICCQLQGELLESLMQNLALAQSGKIPKFNRVLIETTGLADPSGVISTLNADDAVLDVYRYDGTVTVLDGSYIREQLKDQYEAVKQIALADLILISKTDLIDEDEIEAIKEVSAEINSTAKIYPIVQGEISPSVLLDIGPYKSALGKDHSHLDKWLNVDKKENIASSLRPVSLDSSMTLAKPKIIAHTNIDSFSIVVKEPIEALALLAAIELVQGQYGDSILRIKGILNIKGQTKPVVVHGVQGSLYPLSQLEDWPSDNKESKLVFIVRKTVLEQIKHIFTKALEEPDEAAIKFYQEMLNQANLQ